MWNYILFFLYIQLFLGSKWLYSRVIASPNAEKSAWTSTAVLFCVTCTISVSMPVLIVLELLSGGDGQERRLQMWHIDKIALLILNYLVLPQILLFKWMHGCRVSKHLALFGGVVGHAGWLYLSNRLGTSVITRSDDWSYADVLFANFCVSGTLIVATLSGFGAIYGPFSNITTFLRIEPSLGNVADMESRIVETERLVEKKKLERQKWKDDLDEGNDASNVVIRAIFRVTKLVSSINCQKQVGRMDAEIEVLENLTLEMQLELDDLMERREHVVRAKSLCGQVFNCFGWFLTICCIVKLCICLRNILVNQRATHDPVERFLTIVCENMLGLHLNISDWSPPISMAFVGYLTFANTRSFVTQILITLRYFSTQVSNNTIALLVCVITGMYFAATSLLMRVYLPKDYREEVNATVGFDDRHAFQMFFDKTFVVSAMLSAVAVIGNRYYTNQKFRTF